MSLLKLRDPCPAGTSATEHLRELLCTGSRVLQIAIVLPVVHWKIYAILRFLVVSTATIA